jgi:hypothetical protein
MEQGHSGEANSSSVEKFPTFYGTRRFITVFTGARHLSLSSTRLIQSTPSHVYRKIHFNIAYHPRRGLPSGLFRSGFPTRIVYAFIISPIRVTCPAHPVLLDLIILIFSEEYKLWSSSLCSFLQLPVTSLNVLLTSCFKQVHAY